jgi:DNA-binding GntR family transcriptional regulator
MESSRGASERPIAYRALARDLRQAIIQDELGPERRVPTEAELSATYGVSRQTVRRALQDLVAEGLVYRVRGRGTFAIRSGGGGQYLRSFGSIDDLLAMSQDTILEVVSPLKSRVNVEAAGRLDLPNDVLWEGVFRRLHSDGPFCVTQVFLPPDVGPLAAAHLDIDEPGKRTNETLISVIERVREKPISRAHQSITAVGMPADLREALDVPPGTPVLRVDRAYFDTEDRAVELAISHFSPDRYSYRLEMVRVLGGSSHDADAAAHAAGRP